MDKKISISDLQEMKEKGEKITMLTAYDYPTARILDQCGVEVLLIGDSVGNVMMGTDNTLPVTTDEIIYHSKAVVRARKRALVVADMPFMSYQVSIEQAKRQAGRLIKEGGAEAVKLEGGENMEEVIKAICDIDIPVMGHIGLTPQSIHRLGGYKVQGKEEKQKEKLLADALAVERAGAFSIVMEAIPLSLAKEITHTLKIPTIGIGAGIHCDGQVLVIHDLLGLSGGFRPKFVKCYAHLETEITKAVKNFLSEVKKKKFPTDKHSFH
ncbi:MAG: 3-methyl-2-oxobutanoate hydroxymethyltransferase [Deltaproteobacteria bacterium DG_8]|nr:MAG: 3-methyl-2-oxobutanoate hydroxymethyltransferase [Deltaproteobacteria bacterium DG_8]